MSRSPALFLDRDGVVNVEKHYLFRIEDFQFMDGLFPLCRKYRDDGFRLVVITNQSGIARGYYSLPDVEALHAWMRERFQEQGVPLDGLYLCPHHPAVDGHCSCRKPEPGMILQAAKDLDLDLPNSVLLGDKPSDLEAGRRAGIGKLGLVRGKTGIEGVEWDIPGPGNPPPRTIQS